MSDRFTIPPMTLSDVLAVLSPGFCPPGARDIVVNEICIDSRQAVSGSLFVAFEGEQVDGHAYVRHAMDAGANLALIDRPVDGVPTVDLVSCVSPTTLDQPVAVRVPDALAALQALARTRRKQRTDLRVIGVTGSVGKTTAKEVIATVLAQRYPVLRSTGNHNNEIGLPLTLMTLGSEHSHAVLEMGMYDLGEISALCDIAKPRIGVVTNVEPVHLERLGSIERIAEAKSELVRALPSDGVAVLNADDARVAAMAADTQAAVVTYGTSQRAAIRAEIVKNLGLEGIDLYVRIAEHDLLPGVAGAYQVHSDLLGEHAVMPILSAIAVGFLEGLVWDEIESGLAIQGQGLRLTSHPGHNGITILDDAYNSSPPSALSALGLLAGMAGRRVAVLGDMRELGGYEREGHRIVGERAAGATDLLIAVGPLAREMAEAALQAGMCPSRVHRVAGNEEAVQILEQVLRPGDVVLIKGSRSMAMEEIVGTLTEAGR